ncbi:hypothetical protein LLEC1_07294 [Akanthomyces lecanii]|uniref:Zn(2)-C6 fungal-type domain-containing protein n=1 Tax=Cordyceps confragosa TaxID=2714763 RepID=A0A179IT08_CORDF|nr:hypothetical protein LLEC1_07294 [Akanthomyces lecanii]
MESPPYARDPGSTASLEQQLTVRRKRWAPRVRTGCWTCRSRRVKCDEAKPSCVRCQKSNQNCTGYLDARGRDSRGPPRPLAIAPADSSSEELRLNRHFIHHLTESVSKEFNCEFWRHHIPQFALSVPAIWHATNAVSALAWAAKEASKDPEADACAQLYKQAVVQHSASMNHILRLTTKHAVSVQDKTVILLANFFFCALAAHPGNIDNFMAMHKRTVVLIRYWRLWESIDSSPEVLQLLFLFIKSVRICEESLLITTLASSGDWQDALVCLQKRPLSSIITAHIELEMIWISLRVILDALQLQSSATALDVAAANMRRAVLQAKFILWEERYKALVLSTPNLHPLGAAALSVRYILTRICLKLRLKPFERVGEETCWDPFEKDFDKAWCIIADTLRAPISQDVAPARFRPSLRNSLLFIARYCRKKALRQEAAALLRFEVSNGPSGQPPATPLLIESIIALEEGQAGKCCQAPKCRPGEYVCNWHRVAKVHATSLAESRLHEFECLTVGNIVSGRPGTKFRLTAVLLA